jgi:hypothetical protein
VHHINGVFDAEISQYGFSGNAVRLIGSKAREIRRRIHANFE